MKKLLSCFFTIIVATTLLFSQDKKTIPDIEKTYIHTDRTRYIAGESLWYKAYSVYAYNNLLYNHSNILYVELISSNSKIVARNKTKLIGGLGHGDFKLTDSEGVKPGKYQLRAYTNWNRNFGKDFVFKKEIEVLDVFGDTAEAVAQPSPLNPDSSNAEVVRDIEKAINIQFFPEGGSLVDNVASVVAFKAVDAYRNPIAVQGKVFDSNNELVTFFMSAHDGMGKFQLKPVAGKSYYTTFTGSEEIEVKASIPNAIPKGFILSYNEIKNRPIISIETNEATLSEFAKKPITIQYKSRGLLYFEERHAMADSKLLLELPEAELPEGITEITVLDNNLKPQSQRLVYVDKNNNLKVEVTTNKPSYKPEEKVVVSVSAKNNLGEAQPGSFSIAVTDLNGAEDLDNSDTNISSYFLMESDIKGKVHKPGYYFDSSNPARFQHLDLLLLTQGWRDFLWKHDREVINDATYKLEKGINISGQVKHLFGSKPVVGNTVKLALFNKSISSLTQVTDSLGRFNFEGLDVIGKARIILNTKNKRGKKSGMFVLDSIFKSPMDVEVLPKMKPMSLLPEVKQIKQQVYKKYVEFNVLPENVLDEIEVVGKKKNTDKDINIHSKMFQGYVVDPETDNYPDIFQLLEHAIPTLEIGNRESVKFTRNSGGALIVLNQTRILDPAEEGPEYIINMLNGIQPNDVLKIEYDNTAVATMMYGNQAKNGAILIYTKSDTNFTAKNPKDEFQNVNKNIEGYYEARLFYSPNLETIADTKDKNASIRNTLYWNPYVHPDATGVSELNYYNTQVETKVKITLEGITASGIPVVVKTSYSIEE